MELNGTTPIKNQRFRHLANYFFNCGLRQKALTQTKKYVQCSRHEPGENSGFAKEQYDQLLALAKNKPIALAEVGVAPSPEILQEQPGWTWFMVWDEPTEGSHTAQTLHAAYNCDSAINLDPLPWVKADHAADHTFTQP